MTFQLTYSQHARTKLKERNLSEKMLMPVLQNPEAQFYDTTSRAQIAVGTVTQQRVATKIVVVFRRKAVDAYHIVTAYPVKDLENEIRRKINAGRWIPTPSGATP